MIKVTFLREFKCKSFAKVSSRVPNGITTFKGESNTTVDSIKIRDTGVKMVSVMEIEKSGQTYRGLVREGDILITIT